MKKADPFSGIPAVPTSLAGQWLAFNHMANHYRKLLNVKPRVDTSAPKRSSSSKLVPSLSYYLKGTKEAPTAVKPKKATKKPQALLTTCHYNDYLQEASDYNDSFDSPQSSPRTLLQSQSKKRGGGNKSRKYVDEDFNIETADYQVVFGPSSIKSSTDALGSDCESQPDKPKVEVMGVAEKIKVFLNQLHEYDNHSHNNNPSHGLGSTKKLIKTKMSLPIKAKQSQAQLDQSNCKSTKNLCNDNNQNVVDARLSRHSKCFLPCNNSATSSPKKVANVKKSTGTLNPPKTAPTIGSSRGNSNKQLLSEAISKAKIAKSSAVQNRTRQLSKYNDGVINNCSSRVNTGESREKNALGKPAKTRYLSGGSLGSVGTIRGSDELTTEDLLILPLPQNYHQSQLESPKSVKNSPNPLTKTSTKQRNKGGILRNTRNSSAGYCSQSLSGKATSLSSLGVINNKDSSRDSAYGFSSGESRITTRESTPEKMKSTITSHPNKSSSNNNSNNKKCSGKNKNISSNGKYKSSLSTVASSVNLDSIPGNEGNHGTKGKRDFSNEREPFEDKYLSFLTHVTEDIVSRGIYTNRGLKVLFKAHMEHHRGLDPHKMEEMVENLRMDLGIPKDDTLNKLEFGYGSVLFTTDSYSYTDLENKKANHNLPGGEQIVYPATAPNFSINHRSKSLGRKSERTRLLDHHERLTEDMSNSSSEMHNDNLPNRFEDLDLHSSKSDASTALSETELRLTLKEVGIDSETTLEIVSIMNPTRNMKQSRKNMSSDDESDLWPSSPARLNKPSRLRDATGEENRPRHHSRSGSPPSRYSTESS